jgi:hypothetical protein
MINTFENLGFAVIRNIINEETAKLLAIEFNMLRDNYFFNNLIDTASIGFKSDEQVPISFSWYASYSSESLLTLVQPKIELAIGKTLYPSYSYARIYYTGAELPRHVDRYNSDYAATVTISVDETESWPIYIKDFNGIENELHLAVGDACVYYGNKLEHWRNTFQGKKQIQFFLFYVLNEQDKFERRPMLGSSDRQIPAEYMYTRKNNSTILNFKLEPNDSTNQ